MSEENGIEGHFISAWIPITWLLKSRDGMVRNGKFHREDCRSLPELLESPPVKDSDRKDSDGSIFIETLSRIENWVKTGHEDYPFKGDREPVQRHFKRSLARGREEIEKAGESYDAVKRLDELAQETNASLICSVNERAPLEYEKYRACLVEATKLIMSPKLWPTYLSDVETAP